MQDDYTMKASVLLTLFLTLFLQKASGQRISLKAHTDFLYFSSDNKLTQDVYCNVDTAFRGTVSLRCFQMNDISDSTLLYSKTVKDKQFRKGQNQLKLDFEKNGPNTFYNKDLRDVVKRLKYTPVGRYRIYLSIACKDTIYKFSYIKYVDSLLHPDSRIKKDIDDCFLPEKKRTFLGLSITLPSLNTVGRRKGNTNLGTQVKLSRFFRTSKLEYVNGKTGSKSVLHIYSRNWYLGYYELDISSQSKEMKIAAERKKLADNVTGIAKLDVEHTQSLFSQVKDIKRDKNENDEIQGEIGVSGVLSNGQEEFSESDNNYYELRGMLEVPIMDIPVSLQGYYTSQDRNRKIKSSFWRIHYDTEKAREKLEKLMGGYKNKYSETKAKVGSSEGAYQMFLSQLQGQKSSLLNDIKNQAGIDEVSDKSLDDPATKQRLYDKVYNAVESGGKNDDLARAAKTKDSVEKIYQDLERKYQKAQELEEKYQKYTKLLDQYKNTMYFDSAVALSKIAEVGNTDDLSYKELVKKSSGILPDTKVNSFITGITNVDIGTFSKDLSNYTMSGQAVKGIDLGYDIGVCEVGFTLGKAQYINRQGYSDNYTTYAGRASRTFAKKHKVSVFYYGYTPDRKMLNDEEFYDNIDIAMPSFRQNVHIVSARYDFEALKMFSGNSEVATSFRKQKEFSSSETNIHDKLAYNLNISALIPKTTIKADAMYRHVGKYFENNSSPVSYSGTEHYQLAADAIIFRSKLGLGGEFNYLEQQSLSYRGGNVKWGVSVKISPGKRFPSASFSYKPFAAFRSFTDTMNIQQRPMMGAVMTGRVNYTIKRKEYSVMVNGVYTENSSQMDNANYASKLLQLNCSFLRKGLSANIHGGATEMTGSQLATQHANTRFVGFGVGANVLNAIGTSLTCQTGFTRSSISRYSVVGSLSYRMHKQKLSVMLNLRYNKYKNPQTEPWKKLYGASVDINWQFKAKLSEKNNL